MVRICIIGGGPGGYVAAIRAARQGAEVCLIEKDTVGGTCLNRGCIPTKTLLQTAHFWEDCESMRSYGVQLDSNPRLDWTQALRNKDERVATLVGGVTGLLRRHKVEFIKGTARFETQHRVVVGDRVVESDVFILATGSLPALPPIPGINSAQVITSDEALSLKELPKSLLILGGGVIGLELGQLFHTLGVAVTIVEMENRLITRFDHEVSQYIENSLRKQGMTVYTASKVTKIMPGPVATVETPEGVREITCELVLSVAGRRPDSTLAKTLNLKMKGHAVLVDEHLRTSQPNIYAIGDVTGIGMLAHSASHHGIHAVDHALGLPVGRLGHIPSGIYTTPEIAAVGMTEVQAKDAYGSILVGRFPFTASGRALSAGKTEGFVKLIAAEQYHRLLGVHIVGPSATELIAEATLALELECSAEELMETIHAHPTLSESVMEAAFQMVGQGIHTL